ncbi:acr-10 [Pristionchus pacificus]|nr:acr-10 [Pristionchus pacificus]
MIFLCLFLIIGNCETGLSSKAELALYRELLANYNRLVRPVVNVSEPLKVEMKIHLQQIMALDGQNQIIEINAWLRYSWKDYRLTWDPKKFSNISSVRFKGDENMIWRPDILLHNSANEDFDSSFKSNEVVYSTGEVNWVPPGIFMASCKMDITYFPFDDQTCFLEFGSWTSHGGLIDLRFTDDNTTEAMDLSTYMNNGEWRLMSTPAVRSVINSTRTKKMYPVLTFYLNLRRRTLFYLFNIVLPSLLISIMTLMGFCLPAHDMSEKIGFQMTILLSICFFVTIVSEMTPQTSESVPILGIFFSTLTLIISASTAFTITVLNIRYRQEDNHRMSATFYQIFLVWLPWLLLMKRPGVTYNRKKEYKQDQEKEERECDACISQVPHDLAKRTSTATSATALSLVKIQKSPITPSSPSPHITVSLHPEGECECANCVMDEGRWPISTLKPTSSFSSNSTRPMKRETSDKSSGIVEKLQAIPEERLKLQRKVGSGIFTARSSRESRDSSLSIAERMEKYLTKCMEDAKKLDDSVRDTYEEAVLAYYTHIYENIRELRNEEEEEEKDGSALEEWKFAAMALDRLCLVIFTFFVIVCISSMVYATPYLNA